MRTLKLTLAYDGTAYAGWQLQPGKPTVQGTLEDAIAKVTGQPCASLASGRTDAGVHALGQVAAFRTDSPLPPEVLLRALNANLPHDVAVLEAAEAPAGFHPITPRRPQALPLRDPRRPGPRRFPPPFRWHYVYGRLDADAMHRAAAALLGTHDFRSFQSSGRRAKPACGRSSTSRSSGAGQGNSPLSLWERGSNSPVSLWERGRG